MDVLCLPSSAHISAFLNVIEKLAAENDEDTLARIITTIEHVASVGGHPQEPTSRRLKGVDVCEIRSKYHRGELIRIYYYTDKEQDKMLLLNYIIKPDGSNNSAKYEGKEGKRIEKEIQESIELATSMKEQYPASHSDYVPLPN